MTNAENKADDILNAVTEGTDEVVNTEDKAPAKRKATKKKTKDEAPKKEETPEIPPVTIDGLEVAEGVDPEAIEKETEGLDEAVNAIGRKDADLLDSYMKLGAFASKVSPMFKSTRLYGEFLAKRAPASQNLDAPLRSNCKWLFEALNVKDHEASDLLNVLNVNRIEDYKSQNPTVIKRDYKKAQKALEARKKAEAEGIKVGEDEDADQIMKKREKADADAEMMKKIKAYADGLSKMTGKNNAEKVDKIARSIDSILTEAFTGSKKDAIEAMENDTKR